MDKAGFFVQAILLATGENKKLAALLESRPAAMLPIVNRPLMAYTIELLVRQGIKRIVVCLHHLPGSIESWFGSGARWGAELEYVLQREAWGTATSIKWARAYLSETFLVLPADLLVDVDVESMLERHRQEQNAATLQLHRDAGTQSDGAPLPVPEGWEPTGVCMLEPSVIDYIPQNAHFDHIHDLVPALTKSGERVGHVQSSGYYNSLANYKGYHDAQRHFLLSAFEEGRERLNGTAPIRYAMLDGRRIAPGIWCGRNHTIHANARITTPIYVGANCRIGRDVELGPETVIGDNVVIDDGATVRQSTIMANSYVGQLVNLEQRVVNGNLVIDPLTGDTIRVSERSLLSGVEHSVLGRATRRARDTVIALSLLVCLLPLFMLAAPLKLLTGRAFIRMMIQGSSDGRTVHSIHRFSTRRASGEVPWLGRLVERLEWHRLPELWAVCCGDLALVGVMPLTQEQGKALTEEWQHTRFQQPPGITGLWYVRNARDADLDAILVADAYYAATHSTKEELRLFLLTPIAWLRRIRL